GQLGYNWQAGSNIVLGLEGDIAWADIKGTSPCLVVLSCTAQANWTADIAGRVGFLPMERLMVYAKGGVAFANFDYSTALTIGGATLSGSVNATRVGGMFGFGAEYAFLPHWSAKLEYDYMDFGKQNYNVPVTVAAGGAAATATVATSVNQVVHTM